MTSSKCFHLAVPYWFVSGIFLPLSYGSDSAELGKPLIIFHIWNDEYDWSHPTLSARPSKGEKECKLPGAGNVTKVCIKCRMVILNSCQSSSNDEFDIFLNQGSNVMVRVGWLRQIGWSFGKIPNGLQPPPHFRKIMLQFSYNGYGTIYARRYEGKIVWNACR